jgi:hypothetical protein
MDERKWAPPRPKKPGRIQRSRGWMRLLLPVKNNKRGEKVLPSLPQVVKHCFITRPHLFFHLIHTVESSFYLIKGRITSTKSRAETIDKTAVISLSFLRSDIPINLLSHSNTFF